MANTLYEYTIATDINSGVYDVGIMHDDVGASALPGFVGTRLGTVGGKFRLEFTSALSAPDKTTLDGIVAAHVGVEDNAVTGQSYKPPTRAATTAALAANTRTDNILTASANGAFPAIDGVTLVLKDRILVKNEAAGANNGLYVLIQLGDGSTPWKLRRAGDADSDADVRSCLVAFVEEGAVNSGRMFVLTNTNPVVLNTTALVFEEKVPLALEWLETPGGTIDGVNDTFTLAKTPVGKIMLFSNGVLQDPGSGNDYQLSGVTITFEPGSIPQTGDKLLVTYRY